MKRTLRNILLSGAILLGVAGCSVDHSKYNYTGFVGKEHVSFYEKGYGSAEDDNILTVTSPNGKVITYKDSIYEDLKIESVTIGTGDNSIRYDKDTDIGKLVVEEGQKRFDNYLKEIGRLKSKDELKYSLSKDSETSNFVNEIFDGERFDSNTENIVEEVYRGID